MPFKQFQIDGDVNTFCEILDFFFILQVNNIPHILRLKNITLRFQDQSQSEVNFLICSKGGYFKTTHFYGLILIEIKLKKDTFNQFCNPFMVMTPFVLHLYHFLQFS